MKNRAVCLEPFFPWCLLSSCLAAHSNCQSWQFYPDSSNLVIGPDISPSAQSPTISITFSCCSPGVKLFVHWWCRVFPIQWLPPWLCFNMKHPSSSVVTILLRNLSLYFLNLHRPFLAVIRCSLWTFVSFFRKQKALTLLIFKDSYTFLCTVPQELVLFPLSHQLS